MIEPITAFWCRIPSRANFGDALTPWLIRQLTGRYPLFRSPEDPRHKHLVAGSILGMAQAPCTVWGTGIMNADERVDPNAEYLAVRGPLTRARAIHAGAACPAVYGDPALLLPRLYRGRRGRPKDIGLATHFSDYPRLTGRELPVGVRLIDMQSPIETVVDDIRSCKLVAASSLHGLIASHAYGVPACWIAFRPLPSGDGTKFRDYLLSIGCDVDEPLRLSPHEINAHRLQAHAIEPPLRAELRLEDLWDNSPFRCMM